ncbi:wax ester synthase/diacylglycerol acyltransferase 6-like isoform X3 [Euphorbia lathyris]|uniref:wax ester synthase/diacylglycerol acyltransferase 6-like isoform X3 n=1 Tax=Euphorbia lathyris TaxID=212925 RepID=UPI0033132D37
MAKSGSSFISRAELQLSYNSDYRLPDNHGSKLYKARIKPVFDSSSSFLFQIGGYGKKVEMKKGKRFVYCSVSLDDVKLIKTHMDITINDVILGVTQAGLSRYLNRESGENNKKKRVRATVLVNLRPAPGIQKLAELMDKKEKKGKWGWGNRIAYVVVPFNVELQKDPLDYIRKAKVSIDRKKLSLEPFCTFALAEFLIFTFGVKVASIIANRFLSNTTLAFSNVVGPIEKISFYGHPISFLAPSVYGHPHALTIHFQSYAKKMTIVVAVDPDIILHPHKLLEDFEESLLLIRDSIKYKEPLDAA